MIYHEVIELPEEFLTTNFSDTVSYKMIIYTLRNRNLFGHTQLILRLFDHKGIPASVTQ